jgi:CheY-like chemotaxis protein
LFRERGDEIGAIVTDLLMPRLDGWSLVKEVRSVYPRMPIIVMSGFAGDAQHEDDTRLEHLLKPFAPVEIARAIERIAVAARAHTG